MSVPNLAINENLYLDSSFETLAINQYVVPSGVSSVSFVAPLTDNGSRAIRLTRVAAGDSYFVRTNSGGNEQLPASVSGQKVTVSWTGRSSNGMSIDLQELGHGGPYLGRNAQGVGTGSGFVARYSQTYDLAFTAASPDLDYWRFVFRAGAAVNDWAEFDDVKIELGEVATQWVPADAEGNTAPRTPGAPLNRMYAALPDHYRDADAADDYPLYRFMAGVAAELGDVDDLLERFDFDPVTEGRLATSDLADPRTSELGWLPWMAQLLGVQIDPAYTPAEMRDAVFYASSGWRAGTKNSLADVAKASLTGTKYAKVYDHTVSLPGDGGQWDVLLVTRVTETPNQASMLAAITRRGAKPAGVTLRYRAYESSWDTIEVTYPTWTALEGAGSWDRIQEAGL